MSLRLAMAASATLILSVPAAATAHALVVQTATPVSEAEMEAKSQAFEARMQTMNQELQAAITAAGNDGAKMKADTDVIIDRYAPEIVSFSNDFEGYLNGEIAKAADPEMRQQITSVRDQVVPVIRTMPDQLRASIQQAIASQTAD